MEPYRTYLKEYEDKYKEFFKFRRDNGIIEIRMHTNDGPLRWGMEVHRLLIPLFEDIDHDSDNEVVILTGTGDTFNASPDHESFSRAGYTNSTLGEKQAYDYFYLDQTREAMGVLRLNMPVISAINGPVALHPELCLLNDIVICSDTTFFYEAHWDGAGVVPGDGVHTIYRELLGPTRGRYFLLSGQKIFANEALQLGLVSEVVPKDKLIDRAWEIAKIIFMTKSRVHRRLTRALLIQPWRELMIKEIGLGMAHETLACTISFPSNVTKAASKALTSKLD